jgi:hypothetical protein
LFAATISRLIVSRKIFPLYFFPPKVRTLFFPPKFPAMYPRLFAEPRAIKSLPGHSFVEHNHSRSRMAPPSDRSFTAFMAAPLISSASSVISANNIDNVQDLVMNVTLLVEVGKLFF